MNWETVCLSAVFSLISAIVVFYLKNIYDTYLRRKRLAKALLTEINTLAKVYQEKLEDDMTYSLEETEPDENGNVQYVQGIMLVDSACLTIYDHNADKLGYFNLSTIEKIVTLYTLIRGHICSINTWNAMLNNTKDIAEFVRYRGGLRAEYIKIAEQADITKECLKEVIDTPFGRKRTFWSE